jgi:hypothetical protein
MNKLYFYNHLIISKTDVGKGYYIMSNSLTYTIYKTLDDVKNSIDKEYGYRKNIPPKRSNKPIKIIGHMIFKLNENDKGYYEYQWK